MDFEFTEDQRMLRQNVRNFMNKECNDEYINKIDEEEIFPADLYQKMADLGLIALPFPEEYGGIGGSVTDFVIIAEEVGRRNYDLAGMYGGPIFNGLNLLHFGTEAQKQEFIPPLLEGKIRFSVSMTEPNAGSDVGNMKTRAVQDGDDFVINGQKVFATAAGLPNNIITLFCITDPTVHYTKGMTAFLVDNTTPGMDIRPLKTLGRKIIMTNEIFIDNVRVPATRMLGELNGGWKILMHGLELERLFTSAAYVGNMATVVEEALEYSKQRVQFGRPIGNFQAIAHMLAEMQTNFEAAWLLTYRAAWMLEQGKTALKEVCMAKLFGSEAFQEATQMGMQILGGYGYMMEYPMQRHFRDARAVTVTAGSSQIQKNTIAKLMGLKPF